MSAALRLTSGFVRIDRAWSYSPNSPFAKRLRYFDCWRVLIDQAGYVGCKGMEPGVVQITLRQLAAGSRIPFPTAARAVRWLAKHGWIDVRSVRRGHTIFIPHHELVYDMNRYLAAKSDTNFLDDKSLKQKTNLIVLDTKRYKHSESDTNSGFTPEPVTLKIITENDQQKAENEKAIQTSPFLREEIHTYINTYGETNAGIEGDGTGKCASPIDLDCDDSNNESMNKPSNADNLPKVKRQKLPEPNQFDVEIAETWAEGVLFIATQLAEERGRKPPKQKPNILAMAKVVTALRVIDGYSERDIVLATAHRFEDDFYCDTPGLQMMNLNNIREVSKNTRNGFTRFENLLSAAYRAKEMRKK